MYTYGIREWFLIVLGVRWHSDKWLSLILSLKSNSRNSDPDLPNPKVFLLMLVDLDCQFDWIEKHLGD
jgi:hypothetical protein